MKFYHVSTDIFNNIKEFTPRVPERKLKDEDHIQNRVCVAPTLIDCLNGICYDSSHSNKLFHDNQDCNELVEDNYRALKVYEFEYDETKTLSSDAIITLVPDANLTNEHWILENIKPLNSYIINIDYYDIDMDTNIITELDYNICTNDLFYTKVTLSGESLNQTDISESLSNLCVAQEKSKDSITLDVSEFPINKVSLENILAQYFCWIESISLTFE